MHNLALFHNYRSSYLPLHISEVKAHFTQYIKPSLKDSEIWFETENGDKIRWHLPVGVSYDMHERGGGGNAVWQLTVHFSFYPEQVLLRCPSIDCVKAHFMSTIKEADSLKHASVSYIVIMLLWNGNSGHQSDSNNENKTAYGRINILFIDPFLCMLWVNLFGKFAKLANYFCTHQP